MAKPYIYKTKRDSLETSYFDVKEEKEQQEESNWDNYFERQEEEDLMAQSLQDGGESAWNQFKDSARYGSELSLIASAARWGVGKLKEEYADEEGKKQITPKEAEEKYGLEVDEPVTRAWAEHVSTHRDMMQEIEEEHADNSSAALSLAGMFAGGSVDALIPSAFAGTALKILSKSAKTAQQASKLAAAGKQTAKLNKMRARAQQAARAGKTKQQMSGLKAAGVTLGALGAQNVVEMLASQQVHESMGYDFDVQGLDIAFAAFAPAVLKTGIAGLQGAFRGARPRQTYKKRVRAAVQDQVNAEARVREHPKPKTKLDDITAADEKIIKRAEAKNATRRAQEAVGKEIAVTLEKLKAKRARGKEAPVDPKKLNKAGKIVNDLAPKVVAIGTKKPVAKLVKDAEAKVTALGLPKATRDNLLKPVKTYVEAIGAVKAVPSKTADLDVKIRAQEAHLEKMDRDADPAYAAALEHKLAETKMEKVKVEVDEYKIPEFKSNEEAEAFWSMMAKNPVVWLKRLTMRKDKLEAKIKMHTEKIKTASPKQAARREEWIDAAQTRLDAADDEYASMEAAAYASVRFGDSFLDDLATIKGTLLKVGADDVDMQKFFPHMRNREELVEYINRLKLKQPKQGEFVYKTDKEIVGDILKLPDDYMKQLQEATRTDTPPAKTNRSVDKFELDKTEVMSPKELIHRYTGAAKEEGPLAGGAQRQALRKATKDLLDRAKDSKERELIKAAAFSEQVNKALDTYNICSIGLTKGGE